MSNYFIWNDVNQVTMEHNAPYHVRSVAERGQPFTGLCHGATSRTVKYEHECSWEEDRYDSREEWNEMREEEVKEERPEYADWDEQSKNADVEEEFETEIVSEKLPHSNIVAERVNESQGPGGDVRGEIVNQRVSAKERIEEW